MGLEKTNIDIRENIILKIYENDSIPIEFVNDKNSIDSCIIEYRDSVHRMNGYKLYIYCEKSKSEIPHFHIWHQRDSFDNDVTVKLEINEFYIHGKHQKILSNKQMKRIYENMVKNNVWYKLVNMWNKKNPNNLVNSNITIIPNYSKMKY